MDIPSAPTDPVSISLDFKTFPAIHFLPSAKAGQPAAPPAGAPAEAFGAQLQVAIDYAALGLLMGGYLQQRRITLSEGLFKRYLVVESCQVMAGPGGTLVVKAGLAGSYKGTVFLTGTPVLQDDNKRMALENLAYDLQTGSFLLKTARWLLQQPLLAALRRHTTIDLAGYYAAAEKKLDRWLNGTWGADIRVAGKVDELALTGVEALPQHLVLRGMVSGRMALEVAPAAKARES